MVDLVSQLAEIEAALETLADDARATQMAAYMKDRFPFLGVAAGPRRALQRDLRIAARSAAPAELLEAATWCWHRSPRELQYTGCDLLRSGARNLTVGDLTKIRSCITTKSWWDTVDSLAAHTVGTIVHGDRRASAVMDEWIDSDDVWLARTAILHQLAWKSDAEPDRLFDYAQRRAGDTDFFIRKALGWSLRSLARVEPDRVRTFVDMHRDLLSGLTVREATKHL